MSIRGIATAVLLSSLTLGLAACGRTTGDRALSGGLLGAGAGAAVSAVTGGGLATGAVIGGALGAAGGAVTSPGTVNLGRPVWR
ncbi:MAG: hypothetical protein ABIQ82_02570 [Variovorax sp.]